MNKSVIILTTAILIVLCGGFYLFNTDKITDNVEDKTSSNAEMMETDNDVAIVGET